MAKWVVTTGASKCAKRICTIRISERTDTTGAKGNEDIEKAEYLQATLRILVCSRTPPGNLGFSALQVNSLPSSSLPGARASLLTVELLLCVVDTFGSIAYHLSTEPPDDSGCGRASPGLAASRDWSTSVDLVLA